MEKIMPRNNSFNALIEQEPEPLLNEVIKSARQHLVLTTSLFIFSAFIGLLNVLYASGLLLYKLQ